MAAALRLARRCHIGKPVDELNAEKQESNMRGRYVPKVWIQEPNREEDSESGFTLVEYPVRDGSLESRDRHSVVPEK